MDKLERLRKIFKEPLKWYLQAFENDTKGGIDADGLTYDESYLVINENLTRGDFQEILEILSEKGLTENG